MQCKHYHEKKQSINSRRRELHSMLINVTPTNVGKSFSNINNTEVTLTNMYSNTRLLIFPRNYYVTRKNFRLRLDNIKYMPTCLICMEKYLGIKIISWHGIQTCT